MYCGQGLTADIIRQKRHSGRLADDAAYAGLHMLHTLNVV